jgi:hypothetical protein
MRRIGLLPGIGICLGLLAGSAPRPAAGWEEDRLFNLRYFNVPRADFREEEGEIGMDAVRAEALLPIGLSDSAFLLTGLVYNGLYLNYRGLDFSEPTPDGDFTEKDLPKNLHVVDVVLGGGVSWDERWGTVLVLYPGLHSDFDDVSGKDIYFSGAVLATYQVSEDLTLSAGAYYDDSFGYPQLLPMLGAQWRIGETLTLEALLPQFLILAWQFDPAISAGLKCSVEGSQYRLREGHPWKNTVVEYSQILAGPFVDVNLAGDLFLRLEGGFVFSREFEFRDDDSNDRLFDGDIEDTGYAGLSLSYRY